MKQDFKPQIDNEKCELFIRGTHQGVLVMCRDNIPYAVPMNHGYENGRFYFHCAPAGKKLQVIEKNPNVCYVIRKYYGPLEELDQSLRCHGPWESVIAYGRARVLDTREELRSAFKSFMAYYGKPSFEPSEDAYETTKAIVIDVDEMTARREYHENKTEYWIWKR
jgi:nitroimidazol reductase NimA-like FMN-containing flavoprotein (pyridoxamine 5'-phosphate oxidase superfamily)